MDDPRMCPKSLSELIDLVVDPRRIWRPEELGPILRTQLATPLNAELSRPGESDSSSADASPDRMATGASEMTFGELLHGPRPAIEALERVKAFAKTSRHDRHSHLPTEVSAVLYSASIAAALVRCGRRISSMVDQEVLKSFEWALSQPWVDTQTRSLLRDCSSVLERCSSAGPEAGRSESPL